jgi:hypothetical protein
MYAFGDVQHPDGDTVALLEDMTVSFIVDIVHRARPNSSKIAGIPSNQNTINTIAAGILSQDAEATSSTAVSETKVRRGGGAIRGARDSAAGGSSIGSNTNTPMPPRLAAHPYVARQNLTVEDLKFACRKDPKLSSRIEELIYLDKIFTAAQKSFNNPEEDLASI